MITDYINELYKLAGVQKGFYAYQYVDADFYTGYPIYSGDKKFFTSYEEAKKAKYIVPHYVKEDEEYYLNYPEFTGDKQLKLLQEMMTEWLLRIVKYGDEYCVNPKNPNTEYYNGHLFEQTLAETAINYINYRYITKEKVKEILEQ